MESAKRKARQGRRVSVCGAGLRGNPGLTGYERAEASLGLCRPHPPFSPPPASSSPSSSSGYLLLLLFLPLPCTPQQLPPGKGSRAGGSAAASASSPPRISSIGNPRGLPIPSFPPHFFLATVSLGLGPSCFPSPLSPLTSFPTGHGLPSQSHHFHSDGCCSLLTCPAWCLGFCFFFVCLCACTPVH